MASRSNPEITKSLARFSTFCSALTVGFGLVVLTGWALHLESIKRILPGQVTVKANTGICFVFIGLALWLVREGEHKPARAWRLVAQGLALIVSVVGLLSFLEYWYGRNFGIDQLLFTAGAEDAAGSVRPGLMPPITALAFCLLGAAVALLAVEGRVTRWLEHLLASIAVVVSIFGILDFVLDPIHTHTHISPITALALLLFSFGVMFSQTRWGLGDLMSRMSAGGELARRLLPASIVVPTVIAWLRWKGEAAGFYSDWTGLAIMTVSAVTLLAGLTVWTAFVIDHMDAERQKAEQSLRRQAWIVDSSSDAIVGKTLDGIVINWNAGAEATYGFSAEEMIGGSIAVTIPPDRRDEFKQLMQRITRGEQVRQYETVRIRKDGQTIHVSLSLSPLKDESGKIVGASTIARDISERKRAEEELRRVSLYARSLIEVSLDPLLTISHEGKITDVNEATEKVTGVSRANLIGSDFSSYFTEPERARLGYEQVFAQGAVQDYPLAIRSAAGKVTVVLYNATVFKNEAGEVAGVFAAARDVTERKQAEEALQESETKFRTLSELVPQLVWACTPDGLSVYFNQRWVEYTGLTLEESYGRGWNTPFHDDDKQAAWNAWNHAVATGDNYRSESRLRAADGSYRWFLMRGVALRDEAENIVKWFGTCTDIDDMKRAEAEIRALNRGLEIRVEQRTSELRESEQSVRRKLDSILLPEADLGDLELADILDIKAVQGLLDDFHANVKIVTALLDLRGNILALAGWQNICTKFHRQHPESCKNCHESDVELSAGVLEGEFKLYKCKNHMWDVATPIIVGGKHLGNMFCGQFFFESETIDYERFRAQARQYGFDEEKYMAAVDQVPRLNREQINAAMTFLAKLAKMISQLSYSSIKLARSSTQIGRANAELAASVNELEAFSYSVSHDLRAPLRHISGFSKILVEEFGPSLPADAHRYLERIQEGTRRMGQLVDDLLDLGRVGRRDVNLQVVGLKSIVDEVIAGLKPEIGDREVEWKIADLPFVDCDASLMKQVFQNLLSNAVKFTRPRPHARIEIGQEEKDGVPAVYVRDNGVGFSMKYADKLFGVFQRLHRAEDFEGTGVGLATVQRIIQKHGGRIWAEAELDKGATFYFTLGNSGKTELIAKPVLAGEMHA